MLRHDQGRRAAEAEHAAVRAAARRWRSLRPAAVGAGDACESLVRGELDWIVMKILEKRQSRRYETANGFAVERYVVG